MGTFRDIGALAARQEGRVTRAQLHLCGISDSRIRRAIERGVLIPRLPKVYAVGHVTASAPARLWEAVLYAGPGASLSHTSAAQWRGLIKYAPVAIHVSTPRKIASLPNIVVHPRRELPRAFHEQLPVTPTDQTLLDLATLRPDLLPRALAQADYLGTLDHEGIEGVLRGRAHGSAALRRALGTYDPNLARLNEEFEIDFHALCREWGITPLPIPNVEVAPRLIVDALWPDHTSGSSSTAARTTTRTPNCCVTPSVTSSAAASA